MRQNIVSAAFENKQVYRGYRFPLNYCCDLWEQNEMIFLRAVALPTLLLCRKHSRSENEQGVMRPQVGKRVWKMACADLMWDQELENGEWGGTPRTRIIRETPLSTLPLTKVRWHVEIHLYFGCQMTHLARAYPRFSSEQWIGILLVPSFLPPNCHWMGCLSITRLTLCISEDLSVFQNWLILLNG